MVTPLTPKPTRKVEALVRSPSTIASRREEDAALKEVTMFPRRTHGIKVIVVYYETMK
jgi:hypothetical protein